MNTTFQRLLNMQTCSTKFSKVDEAQDIPIVTIKEPVTQSEVSEFKD